MSNTITLVCGECHAVNRIPEERKNDKPICGKCKASLFSGVPVVFSGATFQKHLERNGIPVVVDFWAPWCGPCKMMGPAFAAAAKRLEPRFRLGKVNTETEQQIAARFRIQSIPTLILFRNGKEAARISGALNENDLIRWVESSG